MDNYLFHVLIYSFITKSFWSAFFLFCKMVTDDYEKESNYSRKRRRKDDQVIKLLDRYFIDKFFLWQLQSIAYMTARQNSSLELTIY